MDSIDRKNIRIIVDDEQALYSKFSPDDEFNDSVKSYIKSKLVDLSPGQCISMTVVSSMPIDEKRFRTAAANWIESEKALFRRNEKDTLHILFGTLILGSVLIVLSIILEKRFEAFSYSIIPVMGSLALGRAAGILVIDLPISGARKGVIKRIEENNVITFEYGQ